jgi:hypothetical protein
MTNKQITMDNVAVGDILYSGYVYAPDGKMVPKYEITIVAVGDAVEQRFMLLDRLLTVDVRTHEGILIDCDRSIWYSTIYAIRDWT